MTSRRRKYRPCAENIIGLSQKKLWLRAEKYGLGRTENIVGFILEIESQKQLKNAVKLHE